ncbi:MAG TPA: hypothetical protein DEA91_18845, partial [Paenibacillus sp.]|nr:hypothetical protein [Paenibacillus sp.]
IIVLKYSIFLLNAVELRNIMILDMIGHSKEDLYQDIYIIIGTFPQIRRIIIGFLMKIHCPSCSV